MAIRRVPQVYGNGAIAVAVDDPSGGGGPSGGGVPSRGGPELWPCVGEYPCYDPFLYEILTGDTLRNDAFRIALGAVAQGRTVLDIGSGRDLNWALEAARAGARHVVAVEAIPESYAAAAKLLSSVPESRTIELVQGLSFDVERPERAEVCVAEIIGSIASAEGMLAVMADAHARLLTPQASVVPAACRTMAGAVSLRSLFPAGLAFSSDGLPYIGQVFQQYGRAFDLRLGVANPGPECVLSTTEPVETLRFDTTEPLDATTAVRLDIQRSGQVDGLLLWITLDAGGDARTLDALTDTTNWMPIYFPLFDRPVPVSAGDALDVEFDRRTSDDGVHPDYAVRATLTTGAGLRTASYTAAHHAPTLGSTAVHRDLWGLH